MSEEIQLEIDQGLLKGFIDEALESLAEIDSLLVQLEGDPENLDLINSIFRPVHSIKGNAPFFGLTQLRNLAHVLEDLMSLLRDSKLALSKEVSSVLFDGMDEICTMLRRAEQGEPEVVDPQHFDTLVERVKAAQESTSGPEFDFDELRSKLTTLVGKCVEISPELAGELQELVSILPCNEAENAQDTDASAAGHIISRLQAILESPTSSFPLDDILAAISQLEEEATTDLHRSTINQIREDLPPYVNTIGYDDLIHAAVCEQLTLLADINVSGSEQAPPEASEQQAVEKQDASLAPASGTDKKREASKTMRVSEEHIDTFLGYVGELLIIGEMFAYLERRVSRVPSIGDLTAEFRRTNEAFETVSENLQQSLMSVRKVAVKGLLTKTPRLVRDIATAKEKQIHVEIIGEEVEVDKSLIELMDAPLTHMVRNAADHGIESPAQREQAGKEAEGTIQISVTETERHIVLEVSDDGAGLNYEAIQKKAESLGIVKPGQQLTQEEVVDFLFEAGVSTAEAVTDISGRGVGMDVVKRAIESSGGKISVESSAGKGSLFRVELMKSVTTTIIDGLVIEVGSQEFVVPVERVMEIFLLQDVEVFSATGEQEYLIRQDRVLPIVPSCNILTPSGADPATPEAVVSVRANGREYALLVERAVAVQQVVMKDIKFLNLEKPIFAGGSLIGDGQIALIVDIDVLCQGYDLSRLSEKGKILGNNGIESQFDSADSQGANEQLAESRNFLLTQIGDNKQLAIPLEAVHRLEKFAKDSIERAGGRSVIQYRDEVMPILDLHQKLFGNGDTLHADEFEVVVLTCNNQKTGLAVNSIVDIVEAQVNPTNICPVPGIEGTAVIREKVTDILSVDGLSA